jgi:hypothetical protein
MNSAPINSLLATVKGLEVESFVASQKVLPAKGGQLTVDVFKRS